MIPTKSNLMLAKNTLHIAKRGYELLDEKKRILLREMLSLIEWAKDIQDEIDAAFKEAYSALQFANITMGVSSVRRISHAAPIERGVELDFRSLMGVELPITSLAGDVTKYPYGVYRTNFELDTAFYNFQQVKKLIVNLAMVENAAYRLANEIKKSKIRGNALKNTVIPNYEAIIKNIQEVLEEKEREAFTNLKIIKKRKIDTK